MRIYIQDKDNLLKFNLPAKIDGSMLFSFKLKDGNMENSLNIDAIDGEWVLRSNGNVNVVDNSKMIMDSITLKNYMAVPISITGFNNLLVLFCLPSIVENNISYGLNNLQQITIGKNPNCTISYQQNMMFDCHAIISFENNFYYICPAENSDNLFIYVNNIRIKNKSLLNIGDIIFCNGLRIIWMGKNIIIPMDQNMFSINGLYSIQESSDIDNNKFNPVTEIESNITLYNENNLFSHTPRIRSVLTKECVTIDAPPGKQDQDNQMPFFLSIGSSFTMVGMMSIYGFNLYSGFSSGEKDLIDLLPQMIMISAMVIGSLLMPFLVSKWQKSYAKKREKLRQVKYSDYLHEKETLIQSKIKKEEQILIDNNIDYLNCIRAVQNKNTNFWNRAIKDDDFLNVRLGMGDRNSLVEIVAEEEKFSLDDDNLLKEVYSVSDKYKMLHNVPISVNLKQNVITSILLQNSNPVGFINNLMIQLLSLHSPLDLKIVVFTDSSNSYIWNYLKYTKHNMSDDNQVRFFSTNQNEAKILSQFLDSEFQERKERKDEKQKIADELNKDKIDEADLYDSFYLVITDDVREIKKFKFFNSLIENQYNYGFSLLIFDKNMKSIPNECKKFIVINDTESGMFNDKVDEDGTIKFNAELSNNINMHQFGRVIGNVPIQSADAESQLPNSLSFLQMYNVGKIEQLNIRNRWKTSDPMTSLSAPLGVHTNGELFTLDLHEKFDGPHGLIAGSTGSGKSEFIITYILSMALNYDPKEVQFVLIDYKGGGLAGAFENREANYCIPHLAGTITNLDTAEMNRTLVSINSELKRRQRQFNIVKEQTGESTMDIYKYQRLYREGVIDEPVSHLFIVSDEFAELKAQQPDFMAELISTARIGRSLGVHLILATQKPTGVVNDQIWSNAKFKVCLKVQTRADSMEMLKRPEAASIKEAGRFYLQVGYDEYFDIGQSAWTGEKYNPTDRIVKKIDDSISFIDNNGNVIKKSYDSILKKEEVKKDLGDQLTNIVKYLYSISVEDGFIIKKLWLPSLVKNIIFSDLLNKYKDKIDSKIDPLTNVIFGEYDSPASQEQGLASIDLLNDGNLLVYGLSGSGKENFVSTVIYYLSSLISPDKLNIYIGDFGAETLRIFDKLHHVGGAFVTDENQKLENLIKLLDKELLRRKKDYSDFGGNYIEYNKLSGSFDPFILVVLNNYENFLESYPKMTDVFVPLFRDGPKYGITFIVTTTQQNSVRMRVAQNFMNKICFKMPNKYDYRDLLGSPKNLVPVDNYGRGIVSYSSKVFYEFQTADICKRDDKTVFLKTFIEDCNKRYPDKKAKRIPILPDICYADDILYELKGLDCVPIGVERNSLEVYVYNFLEQRINLIAAKSIKSHIYFLYGIIKQLLTLNNVKVNVIDALNIYRGSYDGVNVCNENFEQGFVDMYKSVQNDSSSKITNIYFIIGISELKKKVSKYHDNFISLFSYVSKCKNNTFVFLDDSDGYKHVQIDDWFKANVNNTFGIWLGEDIMSQVSLGVMSLSSTETKVSFPCIGYPIYQGNHMIIKYVVDGVDKKDE